MIKEYDLEFVRYSGHPTFEVKELSASHQISRRPGW